MPYIPHTPESLVGRSDSKDLATTCRGLTSSGRPCRRSIGRSPRSQPPPSPTPGPDVNMDAITLFCWQHKDQVKRVRPPEKFALQQNETILAQRTSIDTLVDRLGILRVGTPDYSQSNPHRDLPRLGNPHTLHDSFPSVVEHRSKRERHWSVPSGATPAPRPQRKRKESRGLFALLCCITSNYEADEDLRAPRVRASESARKEKSIPKAQSARSSSHPTTARDVSKKRKDKHRVHHTLGMIETEESSSAVFLAGHTSTTPTSAVGVNRPHLPRPPVSETETLLAIIPKYLTPQTTSLLLSELAKPLSNTDGEGYIYIFCLINGTMSSSSTAASTILDVSDQRADQLLQDLSVRDSSTSRGNHLLLKIGRATNVHRRMNQWTRQCGYDLSLVRWYPSSSGPTTTPQKVQHVRRVERLIHLELADKQVKRECAECGQVHREWFSIDASLKGIRDMDHTVRRWVDWAGLR